MSKTSIVDGKTITGMKHSDHFPVAYKLSKIETLKSICRSLTETISNIKEIHIIDKLQKSRKHIEYVINRLKESNDE
jgi:hypothetical protein